MCQHVSKVRSHSSQARHLRASNAQTCVCRYEGKYVVCVCENWNCRGAGEAKTHYMLGMQLVESDLLSLDTTYVPAARSADHDLIFSLPFLTVYILWL